MTRTHLACAGALLLAACGPQTISQPTATDSAVNGTPADAPDSRPATPPAPTQPTPPVAARPPLLGEAVVRAEWAKAANRESCAPIALAGDGGKRGVPRHARFGGGWAVAFDLPELRSAYGVAGTGLLDADRDAADAQRARLLKQWPYARDLARLPQPAFAGYGLMGAAAYPADNAGGDRLHSLAYARVGGQACTYNVWSRISRAHLETLLDNLRVVPRG